MICIIDYPDTQCRVVFTESVQNALNSILICPDCLHHPLRITISYTLVSLFHMGNGIVDEVNPYLNNAVLTEKPFKI